MADMTYIKLFIDYLDAIEPLGDAERGRLFTSLLVYARTGEAPQLGGNERFLFPMMRAQIDRDNSAMDSLSDARSEAGRKGAEAKQANAKFAKQNKQMPDLLSKTSKDKDKDKDKDNSALPFESFWAAYPRKVGKQAAKKAFSKVSVPVKTLIDAVNSQKNSEQWRKDNGQYIPNPATWLNQGRWDDVLTEAGAQPTKEEYHVGTWL
ncbi:MAG: putative replisome organizer protein [Bacteriophage sp.]|nr:MAG: putative replisome organizer protein [Bacteriophage sp.]